MHLKADNDVKDSLLSVRSAEAQIYPMVRQSATSMQALEAEESGLGYTHTLVSSYLCYLKFDCNLEIYSYMHRFIMPNICFFKLF